MLQIKVVIFKKLYKFYIKHFLIGTIVFLININNAIKNSRIQNKKEFNHFFKNRSSDIVLLKLGN